MEVDADFRGDLIKQCRETLAREGFKFDDHRDPERDHLVLIQYCNAAHRRVDPKPRHILKAKGFRCPPAYQQGLFVFYGKVKRGDDLMPHASTTVMDARKGDQMLNEWGIQHFHLGLGPHKRHRGFVERTGDVLFAFVTDAALHCIAVAAHRDSKGRSNFSEQELLEIVHRDWPDLLRHANLRVPGPRMDKETLIAVRQSRANSLAVMSDGTSYSAVLGGTNSAGTSNRAVHRADYWLHIVREAERIFARRSRTSRLKRTQPVGPFPNGRGSGWQ